MTEKSTKICDFLFAVAPLKARNLDGKCEAAEREERQRKLGLKLELGLGKNLYTEDV
jgi:hypothetical protein